MVEQKTPAKILAVRESYRFGRTTKDGGYILDLVDLDE
jgi:hypothetical protein